MKLKKMISKLLNPFINTDHNYVANSNFSFSQCGEDMIIKFICESIDIHDISWIDIGAFHPYKFNNTAYFYLNGYRGINIDADFESIKLFKKHRPGDVNLNIGIDIKTEIKDFYIMSAKTLSTFSKEEAEKYSNEFGFKIDEVRKVPTKTIMSIIDENANGTFPAILSIDIEGMDDVVIKNINFLKTSPIIICAETLSYSNNKSGSKNNDIISYVQDQGYITYADTHINTIFLKKNLWK